MNWFRNKRNGLESLEERLRDERPEPSTELFYRVTAVIRRHDAPEPARTPIRARAAFAVALTAALLVVAAALGGMSYASSGARHTASAISHVFVPTSSHNLQSYDNKSNVGNDNKSNGGNDNNNGGYDNEDGGLNLGDLFDKGHDDGGNPAHKQYIEFELICLAVPPKHPFIHITLNLPKVAADRLIAEGVATLGPCKPITHSH